MQAEKTKSGLREITATSNRMGTFKNTNTVRKFNFLVDEPYRMGGTNEAPTPMEYVLGSFNGCILIVIEMIAKEIGFSFQHIQAESVGVLDPRGLLGTADVSPHFQQVTNTILFDTEESEERLQELKGLVKQRCPVYNLFNDAGVVVELNWLHQKVGVIDQ